MRLSMFKLMDRAAQMVSNVRREKPPIYDDVVEAVGELPDGVIFCWGREIYIPGSAELTDHLAIHEAVHSFQQDDEPEEWWGRYLEDEDFRLAQELQAHRWEYRWMRKQVPINMRRPVIRSLARGLQLICMAI